METTKKKRHNFKAQLKLMKRIIVRTNVENEPHILVIAYLCHAFTFASVIVWNDSRSFNGSKHKCKFWTTICFSIHSHVRPTNTCGRHHWIVVIFIKIVISSFGIRFIIWFIQSKPFEPHTTQLYYKYDTWKSSFFLSKFNDLVDLRVWFALNTLNHNSNVLRLTTLHGDQLFTFRNWAHCFRLGFVHTSGAVK